MRRVHSIDEYVAAPLGAFYVDRAFAFFYPHEELSGYVVWGRPTAADVVAISRILPVVHGRTARRHAVMLDLREMESIESGAFRLAVRYTVKHFLALKRTTSRLALLGNDGVGGALTAGFFKVAPTFAALRLFTEPAAALQWLGCAADLRTYEAFHRGLDLEEPDALSELRKLLERRPTLSVAEVAVALRTTPRTLQRRLNAAGSSLSKETARAQVRLAQQLLVDTNAAVTEIAYEVGCSSGQHFATVFRRVTGESPTAWRAKHR
jgi:AraC-like DNA-binding protein